MPISKSLTVSMLQFPGAPNSLVITSGFLPIEREWLQKYLDAGFVDVFRHLYPEKVQYTWWTNILKARERGIGWRLDYFLVSESLLPRVKDVVIHDLVMGSDHCPLELISDLTHPTMTPSRRTSGRCEQSEGSLFPKFEILRFAHACMRTVQAE